MPFSPVSLSASCLDETYSAPALFSCAEEEQFDTAPIHSLMSAPSQNMSSLPPSSQWEDLSAWMERNIYKKECRFFQKDKSDNTCRCGYPKVHHLEEAIKPENFTGDSWDKLRHVHEVRTDAFGEIEFDGLKQTTAKYARVSSDTSTELLYCMLTEQWELSPPNLLISVTGGAKNFKLKACLKSVFHRGLIKVAQTTGDKFVLCSGAWIITGGTDAGVMKHVGQAVRDYTLSSSKEGEIVAIGIATWGVIHNKEVLINPKECHTAQYFIDTEGQGRLSCLNKNHTHFLLVDDGTCGRYGVEIELRSRLEKLISEKHLGHKDSGVTIPAVCVVLDGGPGTLDTIYNAIMNGTPCVIIEGSGRVADVVAQVSELPSNQIRMDHISNLMKRFFPEFEQIEDQVDAWTKKIQDIVRMPHLLTVFRLSEDSHGGMDVAILKALLQASRTSEAPMKDRLKKELELAVAWNRVDIADTEIFTDDMHWNSADLHQAMFSALVDNKHQFVSLLLENGVNLRNFLEKENTLCDLYKQMPVCCFKNKLDKRAQSTPYSHPDTAGRAAITMDHVSYEVCHLLGSFTKHIYQSHREQRVDISKDDSSLCICKNHPTSPLLHEENSHEMVKDAGRDIFLWAVLQNRKELAEIAWEQCRDSLFAALAASRILKKLSQENDGEEAEDMLSLATHYENQAIGVFTECYSSDKERTEELLVRESPLWGRISCLNLALKADDKNFIALSGVQAHLTQVWCGELSVDNPVWKVLLCMFFPLFLLSNRFLVFRQDEQTGKKNAVWTKKERSSKGSRTHQKPLTCCSRLKSFYGSSQVKFYLNIASYFCFLFLFAGVLLVDFQTTPSVAEQLLYGWVFSLVCEEIRQLFHRCAEFGVQLNAKLYISDPWNVLDVLSLFLFVLGLIFRFTTQMFYVGKILLCFDFMVFCLRVMAIFTISPTLGPKIIIVRKMMKDLFFFLFLLSVWVVGYGVAKQAILIDNDSRLDWIARGAIYEPYLIIFGNFPEDLFKPFDIDSCSMNGTDPLKPKCPVLTENQTPVFPGWLSIVMLCVYLLFANILLINLLIAIFNFTFQEVQDNTDRIWKFQRHELIKEYYSRPAAPPPFIILSHIHHIIRRPLCACKDLKDKVKQGEDEILLSWEALMKDKYLLSKKQTLNQSTERRILDTAQKVAAMFESLERTEEMVSASVLDRLSKLEEQVNLATKGQKWIMDNLKAQGFSAREEESETFHASLQPCCSSINDSESQESLHVRSRRLEYPNTQDKRYPVPDEKVPWEVSFSSYSPPFFSLKGDGDQLDGSNPEYVARNPIGRTGMRGRGVLGRLGPNRSVDVVLTRSKDDQRLEFLAVLNSDGKSYTIPSGFVDSADQLPEILKNLLGDDVFSALEVAEAEKFTKGYVDDIKNTDDAWVVADVRNIHLDRTNPLLESINNKMKSGSCSSQWRELSSKTKLDPNQRQSLDLVAAWHQNT